MISIISGSPGCGKTTLARGLADVHPEGVHFVTDTFYEFVAHLRDPAQPGSNEQNTVIMRAIARAALAYAQGGYHVYVDGVIGPWFLPTLEEELAGNADVDYLVLRASEATTLARVNARQGRGLSPTVRKMHGAFADLGPLDHHGLNTEGLDPDDVLAAAQTRLASGALRLRW